MDETLARVVSPGEWAAFHRIRRATLFDGDRHGGVTYDENHPDDRAPENTPFLLVSGGEAVGVCRLDHHGDIGILRLVAIDTPRQGTGLGRILSELMDAEARRRGIRTLRVNAHRDAVGYYESMGWHRRDWNPAERTGIAAETVQMEKAPG